MMLFALIATAALAASPSAPPAAPLPRALPPNLFAAVAPEGAVDVSAANAASAGQTLTVRGRIGGEKSPLVEGRAEFRLVDFSIPMPAATADGAPIVEYWALPALPPDTLSAKSIPVRILASNGSVARAGLNGVGGLAPGAEVFVTGTIEPASASGPRRLSATSLFVPNGPYSIPNQFFLDTPPTPVSELKAAKNTAKTGDTVTIRGRIGGTKSPFVSGRAMFTLVDFALPTCDERPDDHCPTPWDYCCERRADITANAATILIPGPDGQPLRQELNGLRGLVPGAGLVVIGTVAAKDQKGNMVVHARSIHVETTGKRLP